MVVTLPEVLRDAVPYALPLSQPFRGITVREGVLLRGPSGWGEFAPFDDYSPRGCALWLAAGVEAAFGVWPQQHRDRVPVNAIIPGIPADEAAALARRADGNIASNNGSPKPRPAPRKAGQSRSTSSFCSTPCRPRLFQ